MSGVPQFLRWMIPARPHLLDSQVIRMGVQDETIIRLCGLLEAAHADVDDVRRMLAERDEELGPDFAGRALLALVSTGPLSVAARQRAMRGDAGSVNVALAGFLLGAVVSAALVVAGLYFVAGVPLVAGLAWMFAGAAREMRVTAPAAPVRAPRLESEPADEPVAS